MPAGSTLAAEPETAEAADLHESRKTACCVVGGGPGGMMLALLLARFEHLVDVNFVDELTGVERAGDLRRHVLHHRPLQRGGRVREPAPARLHAVHHSQEELSILTTFRAHPLVHAALETQPSPLSAGAASTWAIAPPGPIARKAPS